MNCYQKILQKNVYRTCAGNCKEIASVVSLHRNDKFRGVMANAVRIVMSNAVWLVMARSLLRRRGHLVFCHYERSEVIQKQVLLATGLLPPRHKCRTSNEIATPCILHVSQWQGSQARTGCKCRVVMARGLVPRGHLLASCHRERSVAILFFVITSVAK